MATGEVVYFNSDGGYGFIETEDSEDDVFFHMDGLEGPDVEEGDKLEFEITKAPKGPRADKISRL